MKVPEPRKLSSGKWFIQLRLGGESIPVSDYNKKECIRRAQFIKAEYLAGKRQKAEEPAPAVPTLYEAIDSYIAARSNTLSPSTIRGYRIIQRHRFQDEMQRRLDEINDNEWQGIINKEAGKCAPKTLKNAWGFIRSVVEDAVGRYPPDAKLPALAPPDKPFLNPEQIKVFVKAVSKTDIAIPALLALSSLRISEIEALDWENIPSQPKFIRVAGAVVKDEHNKSVKKRQNKNASSTRNVPVMIPELAVALERDRKPSGPVMRHGQGSLRRAIHKVCIDNSLPDVGVHGLRHPNVKHRTQNFSTFFGDFQGRALPPLGVFLFSDDFLKHRIDTQVDLTINGRVNMNAAPMEKLPKPNHLVYVPAQPGEIREQKHIHGFILHSVHKLLKSGAVKCQAATYIAGTTDDLKAMFFCVAFKPVSLSSQQFFTVRAAVRYTAVYPSPFLVHHISSMQKSFVFQAIST